MRPVKRRIANRLYTKIRVRGNLWLIEMAAWQARDFTRVQAITERAVRDSMAPPPSTWGRVMSWWRNLVS